MQSICFVIITNNVYQDSVDYRNTNVKMEPM